MSYNEMRKNKCHGESSMHIEKADKTHKLFNRECKKGRSLFFLSVVLSGAALSISAGLTGCSQKNTGILSNNFHVYRAVKIAEKAGYEHPYGIAAPSDPIMQVHYVVREAAALIKAKIYGNI